MGIFQFTVLPSDHIMDMFGGTDIRHGRKRGSITLIGMPFVKNDVFTGTRNVVVVVCGGF